jgi:transcriptional regulator GlxA family with amidase domain
MENPIQHIGVILADQFALMSLASATEPLRAANLLSGKDLYKITFIAAEGSQVSSSLGLLANAMPLSEAGYDYDLVLVAAAGNPLHYQNPKLTRYLRTLSSKRVNLGGIAGGPVLLAKAGLLKNKRFTVHWEHFDALQELDPTYMIERNLYVIDQGRYTCAGGVAPIDMMNAIITKDHGDNLAKRVNDWLINTSVRQASDPQRVGLVEKYSVHHPALLSAIKLMQDHLSDPLSSAQIASLSNIGERQLSRLFQRYLGKKINQFYAEMRLEHSHKLVKQTSMQIVEIAVASGYESAAYFSQKFKMHFGYSPTSFRKKHAKKSPDTA